MTTTQRITFVARSRELRIVMKPSDTKYDSRGDKLGVDAGRSIQFVDSKYTTADPEEVSFLRDRLNAIDSPGLYELGVADAPPAEATLVELINIAGDHEQVRKLLEQERSEYNRKAVVQACLKILGEDPDFAKPPAEGASAPAPAPADPPAEPKVEDDPPAPVELSEDSPMAEIRAAAKALDIKTFQKSKTDILAEIKAAKG